MDASKPHTVCYLPLPPNLTSLNISGPASSPTCAYITPADPSDPSDPNNTPTLTVATFSTTSVTSIGSIPFPDAESCCVDLSSRVYVFTSSHVSTLIPEFTPTGDPCIPATSTLNPVHPDPLAWTFGPIRHSTSLRPSTLILELLYSPNLSLMTFNENNTVTRTDLRIPLCTNPKSITKLRRTGDDICIFYDLFYDIYTVIGSMVYSSQRYNYDSASTSCVTSLLTALSTTPSNLHIDYNAYTTATHLRIYSPPPPSLLPLAHLNHLQTVQKTSSLLQSAVSEINSRDNYKTHTYKINPHNQTVTYCDKNDPSPLTRECTYKIYEGLNTLTNRSSLNDGYILGDVKSDRFLSKLKGDGEMYDWVLEGFGKDKWDVRNVVEFVIGRMGGELEEWVFREFKGGGFEGDEGVEGGRVNENVVFLVKLDGKEGCLAVRGEDKVKTADFLKTVLNKEEAETT
ncbi:hypothetical protein TrVE_jg2569 [Triparma verrucosa]|uniref:Uncharacterized protein n=1 Tax=Triparma verrucosa TaxID=1606542 RepID=A0A9W7KVJ5_9STRA|nr:hypothetical protein TrVE_jg2569 [Triparma verrucosa]